jgi:hypothetical protein
VKTSDSIANIAAALALAQGAMTGAAKGKINPHFKSKYADLESVVDAIKKPLTDNGIAFVQFLCTNEKDELGVETMLMHSSGEWIRGDPYYIPVAKHDAQGFGSAATYCRRYSLMAACGIAPEDDDGNAAASAKPSKSPLPEPIPANIEGKERLGNMTDEQQAFMREQAMIVMGLHKDGADLVGWVDAQHFDNEEKLALWYLLPSDVRSTFKKQQAAKRTPALASQP